MSFVTFDGVVEEGQTNNSYYISCTLSKSFFLSCSLSLLIIFNLFVVCNYIGGLTIVHQFNDSESCQGYWKESQFDPICPMFPFYGGGFGGLSNGRGSTMDHTVNPWFRTSPSLTTSSILERDYCGYLRDYLGNDDITSDITSSPTYSLSPSPAPTIRSSLLLDTEVRFSISNVHDPSVTNSSVVREGIEKLVCSSLGVSPWYCVCEEDCLSVVDMADDQQNATRYLRGTDTLSFSPRMLMLSMYRNLMNNFLSPLMVHTFDTTYTLHVKVNVSINTIDFSTSSTNTSILSPSSSENVTEILQTVQQLVLTIPSTLAYYDFFWNVIVVYNNIWFSFQSTLTLSNPSLILRSIIQPIPFIPPIIIDTNPTIAPSTAPSLVPKISKGDIKDLSIAEIIGLAISIFVLLILQAGALYLCCCSRHNLLIESSSAEDHGICGNISGNNCCLFCRRLCCCSTNQTATVIPTTAD